MAISKMRAQSAMNALKNLGGSDLASRFIGYAYRKHMTKALALQAAVEDEEPKGYVKKLVTKEVLNLASYKKLGERAKRHTVGLHNPKKPKAQHFGKNKNVNYTLSLALSNADYNNLLAMVACTVGGSFYRAGVDVDSRFLYVIDMPAGFVGRSIDDNEVKTKDDLDYLVLIVIAPNGGNVQLLNLFPANADYLEGKVELA